MIIPFPNESRFGAATIDRLKLLGYEYANGRELREHPDFARTRRRNRRAPPPSPRTLTRTRDYLLPKLLSGEVEAKTVED